MLNEEDINKAIEGSGSIGDEKGYREPDPRPDRQEPDPEEEQPDFELRLTEIEVTSGSMPITWCVSPEWLEVNDIWDYWVLFIVAPPNITGKHAEWRGYAKLSDMMAYITFYRPGKNRIYACLSNNKEMVKKWMARREGKWRNEYIEYPVLDFQIEQYQKGKWKFGLNPPEDRPWNYLDVDMPEDCFASEPWEFEKTWVNWLWRDKAIDQCEFRKRRMFAYSIQPFIFFFMMILRFIVAFGVSIMGCKGVNYSPLWNPFTTSLVDIIADIDGSYLIIKKLPEPFCYTLLAVPPLAVLSGFVGFSIEGFGGLWLGLLFPLGFVAIVVLVLMSVLGFEFLFSLLGVRWMGMWESHWTKVKREREACQHEHELMMCSTETRITRIGDLPKRNRTVRLRFQGLKSMVCKPFSK